MSISWYLRLVSWTLNPDSNPGPGLRPSVLSKLLGGSHFFLDEMFPAQTDKTLHPLPNEHIYVYIHIHELRIHGQFNFKFSVPQIMLEVKATHEPPNVQVLKTLNPKHLNSRRRFFTRYVEANAAPRAFDLALKASISMWATYGGY